MTAPATAANPGAALSALLLICRLGLGGIFAFAAVTKLLDVRTFAESIMAFKAIPADREGLILQAAYALPWIELLASISLILGLWTRAAAAVIAALLVVFIALILSVLVRGLDVHCACFGKFHLICTGPVGWCKVGENAVLTAAALLLALAGGGRFAWDAKRPGAAAPGPADAAVG